MFIEQDVSYSQDNNESGNGDALIEYEDSRFMGESEFSHLNTPYTDVGTSSKGGQSSIHLASADAWSSINLLSGHLAHITSVLDGKGDLLHEDFAFCHQIKLSKQAAGNTQD